MFQDAYFTKEYALSGIRFFTLCSIVAIVFYSAYWIATRGNQPVNDPSTTNISVYNRSIEESRYVYLTGLYLPTNEEEMYVFDLETQIVRMNPDIDFDQGDTNPSHNFTAAVYAEKLPTGEMQLQLVDYAGPGITTYPFKIETPKQVGLPQNTVATGNAIVSAFDWSATSKVSDSFTGFNVNDFQVTIYEPLFGRQFTEVAAFQPVIASQAKKIYVLKQGGVHSFDLTNRQMEQVFADITINDLSAGLTVSSDGMSIVIYQENTDTLKLYQRVNQGEYKSIDTITFSSPILSAQLSEDGNIILAITAHFEKPNKSMLWILSTETAEVIANYELDFSPLASIKIYKTQSWLNNAFVL